MKKITALASRACKELAFIYRLWISCRTALPFHQALRMTFLCAIQK